MTGTVAVPATTPAAGTRGGTLTGTGTLVGFMLRRDRVKLPAWALGIAAFWLYYTRLVPEVYPNLDEVVGLVEGPMGRIYSGPGYGFDQLSHDRFIVGAYGLFALVLAGVMSILAVARHSRGDEQAGRTDLVRAAVVGRRAPLTAALVVAAVANLVAGLAVTLVTATSPLMAPAGAALFGAGVAATGLAFAGLTAVTVQLSAFSRTGAGLAGAGLGIAFVLRALGDMAREGGSALSWLSPLGWAQQTAPYVLDRWWPLALSLAFAGATMATAFALADRRDLGAGVFSTRPGRDRAPAWLGSPLTLSLRLQRGAIVAWTVALAVAGALFGAWTDALIETLEDLPEVLVNMTGADDVVGGFLAVMALFMALISGIYVVLAMLSLRAEETGGRADPLLASPVSRLAWLGGHVTVTAAGVVVMLGAAGLGTGVGAAVVTGEPAWVGRVTLAHLIYVPAVWAVLGLATTLFGLAPRLIDAVWVLLGYGLFAGVFGPALKAPDWTAQLSVFEHVARYPRDDLAAAPLAALTLLAALLVAVGLAGVRRRAIASR